MPIPMTQKHSMTQETTFEIVDFQPTYQQEVEDLVCRFNKSNSGSRPVAKISLT